MNGEDDEIAKYVQSLLDHGRGGECECRDCTSCRTLQAIFEVVRDRLFTSFIYSEVMMASVGPKDLGIRHRGAGHTNMWGRELTAKRVV